MPHPSETRLLVLHGVRLKGFGEASDVTAIVSVELADVEKHLSSLRDDDLVLYREGRLSGWALTPAGRAEQERLLAEELAAAGSRATVDAAYRQFLGLNHELLATCTAWQMNGEALNDHSDAAYDDGVIARLGELHQHVEPILASLEGSLDRYQLYRGRFDSALAKLRGGDHDWFTKPLIDSYHTVWFQLHEDLLNTLGIERSQEGST